MHTTIETYNNNLAPKDSEIADLLYKTINDILPGADPKIWHAHPVWFINGNPIVGYSKLKGALRLLFWSGQSFEEAALVNEGKFKAAEIRYTDVEQIDRDLLVSWLHKAEAIQWDYKNLVKRKGVLLPLK